MNNRKFRFGTLLVFLAAMTFTVSFMTSCTPKVPVRFMATYTPTSSVDTVTFEAWSLGELVRDHFAVFYPTPQNEQDGQYEELPIYHYTGVGSVSTEDAFTYLSTEYDSVRFTRSSDGLSTITYRHDENASDAQRYFFTREAWKCSPDDEGYDGVRTYTLILKGEMFE